MYILRRVISRSIISIMVLSLLVVPPLAAHHFKGLPHFNYFENYPQIPQDEFLGQSGDYECSLVIYDFQGIDKREAEMPDKVCFYLVIFNLRENSVYAGALDLDIMDADTVVYNEHKKHAVEENIYTTQRNLSDNGDYAIRVRLADGSGTEIMVPFVLSSQKIAWGKWVALIMVFCVVIAAVGSRRTRVRMDRKENVRQRGQAKEINEPEQEPGQELEAQNG